MGGPPEPPPVVVLGSVNADHVVRVAALPDPGQTVHGRHYAVTPGGKGANQAVAAARAGGRVAFIACVGDDGFGREIVDSLAKKEGIDVRGVQCLPGRPSGVALIFVDDRARNVIVVSGEANSMLTEEYVRSMGADIAQGKVLLLQLETPMEAVTAAAQIGREHGVKVVLNPAPAAAALPQELLQNVDLITPNESEAKVLTGVTVTDGPSAAKAAEILHSKGIKEVIITLGAQGAFYSCADCGDTSAPKQDMSGGHEVVAVDTTGAGDCFNGALVAALAGGRPTGEAIKFAHGAAALSVTKMGAQTSTPSYLETIAFLESKNVNL